MDANTNINIIFSDEFYDASYSDDAAAVPGRMESIMNEVSQHSDFAVIKPQRAELSQIETVHTKEYIETVRQKGKLFDMAMLSAGSAITAAEKGYTSIASVSLSRPPGHHAYRSSGWGYCHFSNMALALNDLKRKYAINSAFILDFDAHTGDGTIDCLKDWKEVRILNPMAETSVEYLKIIDEYIAELPKVDIVAVCAGFDSYLLDLGKKLSTFDFYVIGRKMKQLSKKISDGRRFATLEGGYYLPDLGRNFVSFCDGFKDGQF